MSKHCCIKHDSKQRQSMVIPVKLFSSALATAQTGLGQLQYHLASFGDTHIQDQTIETMVQCV